MCFLLRDCLIYLTHEIKQWNEFKNIFFQITISLQITIFFPNYTVLYLTHKIKQWNELKNELYFLKLQVLILIN